MKLLFAEDDRDISKAVTTVLQGQNYGVDTVFTGTAHMFTVFRGNMTASFWIS